MNKASSDLLVGGAAPLRTKSGYEFNPEDDCWQLDKNSRVIVGAVCDLLKKDAADGYVMTLTYYAQNFSSGHVVSCHWRFLHFLRATNASEVSETNLINYRASLSSKNEWYLGTIRGLLKRWHSSGHAGVSDEVIELLNGWTIKGNEKGDTIKRLDPEKGPLSDIELLAFNEGAVSAFESGDISLSDMAMGLAISNTGRRPIQITHLRLKDILKGKNKRGEDAYYLNIPRAKQRTSGFRERFNQFAITEELWAILTAQAEHVVQSVESSVGFELQVQDRHELPLFPDMDALQGIASPAEMKVALKNDQLHSESSAVSDVCKNIVSSVDLHSERTGKPLNISSNRFRYTTGTRAAREGFGEMVIAGLLDHSDNQNAGVYIENIPEHVEKLDEAVGQQMSRYAQAFAGVLVDREKDANRGDDLSSRIKARGEGIGTCGNYGFCGASVPVPCYTCVHFQPWLDGPHEKVYKELLSERQRLQEVTGDNLIAAVNDRCILAVADVIERCAARKDELAHG